MVMRKRIMSVVVFQRPRIEGMEWIKLGENHN